ncbi:MAG: extracellular solute-binding protein [Oscillospiraceae bacterium]|nr:extracellular solute-binding protein [Oscillospiraceae bacterium]
MKKLFSVLLLLSLLLSCLFLAGCHGTLVSPEELGGEEVSPSENAFQVPEHFDESKKIEIDFWAKNDSNKTQIAIYRSAINAFQALYPNVTVNLRLYTDYGRIYNDVITNIPTRTTPNVCITYPDHIATYMTGKNVVVSLEELAADPSYGLGGSELKFDSPAKDEIVPQFYDECHIGGVLYALPFMRSTEACYVNKTYVEKLGFELPETLTWDFVWEVSEAALEKDASGRFLVNGQEKMIPFIYKSTDNMMIQMLRQKGAGYSTAEGEVLLFNETTKELLLEIAQHARSRAFSTFKISSYPANWLNAGQCIFAVDSTAGATWIGTDAPLLDIPPEQLVEFETVVMTVPQFDPENPKMISQGPSVCLFYKDDPQEVLASWLFTQFLLTNDTQIAYSETEGYVPVTLKAQQDPVYQDYLARSGEDNQEHYRIKIEAAELLMANTANTFTTPVFQGSTSVRDAAGLLIENVTKAERRKQPVDEKSLDQLRTDACSLYQLNPSAPGWTAQADASAELSSPSGAGEQGPLPTASRVLLGTLAAVWVLIGLVYGYSALKRRRERHKKFT